MLCVDADVYRHDRDRNQAMIMMCNSIGMNMVLNVMVVLTISIGDYDADRAGILISYGRS